MRQQIRHAAGAAIFDVIVDRMGIAAGGLERGEYRRGLGPARDHEALAEHEIFEPALFADHAMLGGIEVGHGDSSRGVSLSVAFSVSQPAACDNWYNDTSLRARILLCMGLFSRFWFGALRQARTGHSR